MSGRSDVQGVKEGLKLRIEDWCRMLLPDGLRQGRLWVSYNPVTGDYDRSSPELKVALTGDTGAWKCWRSGDKGDVIGLAEYVKGCDFRAAMDLARDFLGLKRMSGEERERFAQMAAKERRLSDERARQREAWVIRMAEQIYLSGAPEGAGSAAEVHARAYYRQARGIDIDRIVNRDRSTARYGAAVEYWPLAQWRIEAGPDGRQRRVKVADGPRFPAICSAMRTATGIFRAVHVTFLDPVRPDKADPGAGRSPRLMFGMAGGAAMWLTHGPEGAAPPQAKAGHPLILSEGRETGDALALAIPEARVWACGSINGIGACPVGFPFVSRTLVAGENDWDNPQAQRQLEAALAALEACGPPLDLMRPHAGSDFNDLLKGDF